ncbi:MAG TPA: biotin-dependent carboxyltransferase family protein [Propionibacteriaceae bacterium]|nr:biotin-dependent carboxyltransferase family protein [Propionibacteriaceae bacterium]
MAIDRALEVLAPGPLTLVQDLGRVGLAAVGVGRSGAADRGAFRLGARLLAQPYTAAALEVLFGGLSIRAQGSVMLALTGAPAPADIDGRGVGHCGPFTLGDGQILTLGTPPVGLRTYVSVRGGVNVPPILGSRATDTLSGLGPEPIRTGDVVPIGPPPADFPNVDQAPTAPLTGETLVLYALRGPRDDWLADVESLTATEWTVSSSSDRVGIRLTGEPLQRHGDRVGQELPSEGVVRGSIQVPPGGEPVIFLADHPVTGGYPVVAVLLDDDIDRAAQAVPGQRIRIALAG